MPIFIMMVVGYVFRRTNIMSENFTKEMNAFVFKIALPVLVFGELYEEHFSDVWDTGFVLFCFLTTLASIMILAVITVIFKGIDDKAEFIQASFRSSAALLGVGIVQNLYDDAGFVPLMIVGAVPLYNITAVILLTILKPGKNEKFSKDTLKKTLYGIITNPIILGIVFGFVWSIFRIPSPFIFKKSITYIGNIATPLGLMALGASLDLKAIGNNVATVITSTTFKLVGFCIMFLPLAIYVGYRRDKLLAILIMLGSPTTVSSFVMAKSMGHDGQTSAGTVMCTTLISAFTLTLWLFILKNMNLI
ncbi:MAG: AEC family transporter [Lachnospiraceae bacterium]|nr:AEC family transporter [Lachnospiraceae bacterium]